MITLGNNDVIILAIMFTNMGFVGGYIIGRIIDNPEHAIKGLKKFIKILIKDILEYYNTFFTR